MMTMMFFCITICVLHSKKREQKKGSDHFHRESVSGLGGFSLGVKSTVQKQPAALGSVDLNPKLKPRFRKRVLG